MLTTNFESSYSKIQKKRKVETLIESQKGTMNKFIKMNKMDELENISGCSLNEQDKNNIVSDVNMFNSQTHDND